MKSIPKNSRYMYYIVVVLFSLCISIPVVLPYFHKGYFPTHDGEWAVVRLADMFRQLRDHQIPPRYSGNANFAYGYPLFNFAYPFPYYLGIALYFLKFSFVDSIKLLFAASVPLSAFFMFLASKQLWKNTLAGIVSAVLFIYFPYRMVDLYARGSIGESLSFALFPALFFFILKILDGSPNKWNIIAGALFYGILITTHNIMAIFFSIILVFFLVSNFFVRRKEVINAIAALILGLCISAFFWIPALVEKQYILLSKIPIADRNLYYATFDQLVIPRWGYGAPIDSNGFSYQLGLPHIGILLLILVFLLFLCVKRIRSITNFYGYAAFIFFGITFLFLFLLFRNSSPIWKLPFLSEINYPWTLLGPLGFLISLLAGFLTRQSVTKYVVFFLSLASIIIFLPYAKPQYYINREDNYYLTNDATTTSSSELMPLWVKKIPTMSAKEKVEIVNGQVKINNLFYNSKMIYFNTIATNKSSVQVNTIYYPGWQAKIDGVNALISYGNDMGAMQVNIPLGHHEVSFSFTETPLRLVSDYISMGSIVFLFSMILFDRKKKGIVL